MNKKVVTFLSLFSLVLILSIYYVISPFGNNIDPNNGLNVNVQVNNENDEYFASLEVAKEDNYQEYIDEMNAIIASSECTNEQKKEALENIAVTTLDNLQAFFDNKPLSNEVCYNCQKDGDCRRDREGRCF